MSCSVILFNKFLYVTVFPYPLTLTCIHMAFASTATWTLRATGQLVAPTLGWRLWGTAVAPIGVLYAISLATSNLGAARLSVSFVQMIKALTPLVTLGVTAALGVEAATMRQAAVVGVMCLGVVVASYGELRWNSAGVAFQVTSVVAEGARLVVTQILLQKHLPKSNPLVSLSIFAPPCFALLAPIAATFEGGALTALALQPVAIAVAANTLTAFVLNVAVVVLVTRTSGLVLTLAGTVKDIMLIVASVLIFWNPVTAIQVVGYILALLSLNAYNLLKSAPKDAPPPPLARLALDALRNRQAFAIYAGSIVLFIISRISLTSAAA
ncbi:MAG: hypothetical protein M9934_09325 [Thermomicrobiales bacterium]|nr:hypothetical protein [Thermomicrobiales bacterium]